MSTANQAHTPIDLETLLPLAVRAALRTQQWPEFLDWMRTALPAHAASDLQLAGQPQLQRAMTLALARALWNSMPLPRLGFLPEPVPEPGRNELCPCGSGEKYKRCCAGAASLPDLDASNLWFLLLEALSPDDRATALTSRHLPRAALAEHAQEQLEQGHAAAAIELLQPQFTPDVRHHDDVAGFMLMTLCDALEQGRGGQARKRQLLECVAALPQRSALRSDAWQRLACIRMDEGSTSAAWQAFKHAQQDNPADPALGMLEVQLLMGEGKADLARQRARFHRAQLLRRGDREPESRLLSFYDEVVKDPGRALAAVSMRIEGGSGERLADWIDRVRDRPLPDYRVGSGPQPADGDSTAMLRETLRQMGVTGKSAARAVREMQQQLASLPPPPKHRGRSAATPPSGVLEAPAVVSALDDAWRSVFTLDKPLSVQPLPPNAESAWQPESEARWCKFLEAHDEAFDSIDILDDLTTAVMVHPQIAQGWLQQRLAQPLLERSLAILTRAVAAAPHAELHWAYAGHRPALRSLVRLGEMEVAHDNLDRAVELDELLLQLNPPDNHGVRYALAITYLHRNDARACLLMVSRYADDPVPELRYNEALAHYSLGQLQSGGKALARAHKLSPRVARYLLTARVRRPKLYADSVSLLGDDRAWLYRDAMRSVWQRTPGALGWAKKVLGPGVLRG